MKIAVFHVTNSFALGGSETYAWALARFLHQRGHTVHVYAGAVPEPVIKFPELDVRLARFIRRDRLKRFRPRTRKIIERLTFGVACRKLFLAEKYDVINIHKTYDIPFAMWARKRTGCRIVWRSHGPGLFWAATRLVDKVDAIYAVSRCTSDDVLKNYGVEVPVIHTGVETDFFRPSGKNIISGVPRLLYFGRLQGFKGIKYLVEALDRVRDLDWEAHIVGDGAEKDAVESQIRELGLSDRIHMQAAKRTPADVRSILDESNIVFFPSSQKDTFSNAMLEAMSMGRAIVASNTGGFPEAITSGENGILVPHGDPGAIADAIRKLIDSPELFQKISGNCRPHIERHFESRSNFERVERLMEETASLPAGAGQ